MFLCTVEEIKKEARMRKLFYILSGLMTLNSLYAQPVSRLVSASGLTARGTENQLTNVLFRGTGIGTTPRVDDRGRLFYQSIVRGANVTSSFDSAYFHGHPGRDRMFMREGAGFPSISSGLTFGLIGDLPLDRPQMTRGGSIAFKTVLSGPEAGPLNTRDALVAGPIANLNIIAREGNYPDFMIDPDDISGGFFFNYHRIGNIQSFEIAFGGALLFHINTKTNLADTGYSSDALMLGSINGYELIYKSGVTAAGRLEAELYRNLKTYTIQSANNFAWAATYQSSLGTDLIGVWRASPIFGGMQVLDYGDIISSNASLRTLRDVERLWLTEDRASMYVLAAVKDDVLGDYAVMALGREDESIDPATTNRLSTLTWFGEDFRTVPGRPDLIFTNSVEGQWSYGSSIGSASMALLDGGDMLVHAHAATDGAVSKELIFRVVGTNFVELLAQGSVAPGGGAFDGFSDIEAMGTNHVVFKAATRYTLPVTTTYDLWYMRAESEASPVKLLGEGDVFEITADDVRTVQFIHKFSANRFGDVIAQVSFTNSTTGLVYIHAPDIAAPHMILSETLVDGVLPIEIPFGIPGYRLMYATSLAGSWTEWPTPPATGDESIRWDIPLDTPGLYFRFEPDGF